MGRNRQLRRRAKGEVQAPTHQGLYGARQQADLMSGQYNRTLADQYGAMDMAGARARGEAPSLAQAQLQQAGQQNLVNQLGAMSQAGGASLAAQSRAAQGMGAAAQMGTSQNLAQLRAEEQRQAEQAYMAQANQLAMQAAQRDAAAQAALGGVYGQMYQGDLQARLGSRALDIQQLTGQRQYQLGVGQQVNEGIGNAVNIGMMMSDENVKDDIRSGGDEAMDALRGLSAVTYRYKHSRYGPDDRDTTGILAQDLEKSEAGKRIVRETPLGKAVDLKGATSLTLAGLSEVVKRLDRLEGERDG